jgi:hypothetical protein
MVLCGRNRVPGGTYFFRVTLAERSSDIDGIVVLPDHLHAVWTTAVR